MGEDAGAENAGGETRSDDADGAETGIAPSGIGPDTVDWVATDLAGPGTGTRPKGGWRRRTARGALITGMALGFQQVFEEKREEPSIMLESSVPPPDDQAVGATVDGLAPRRSVVRIRPWLLHEQTQPAGETPPGDAHDKDD